MADMTLDDLTLEMMEANQNLVKLDSKLTSANNYLNNVNSNAWASFEVLHDILEVVRGNNLATIEKARENEALQNDILGELKKINENTKQKKVARELDTSIGALGVLAGILAALAGMASGYLSRIAKMTKWLAETMWKGLKALGAGVSKALGALRNFIKESGIAKRFAGLLEALKNEFRMAKAFIKESALFKNILELVEEAKNLFRNLKTTIKESALGKYVLGLIEEVKMGFTLAKNAIKESAFVKYITGLIEEVKMGFTLAKNAIKESSIVKYITGLIDDFKLGFTAVKNAVKESSIGKYALEAFDGIKNSFRNMQNVIKEGGAVEFITEKFKSVWTFLKDSVGRNIEGWKQEFKIWGDFFKNIGTKISELMSPIKTFLQEGAAKVGEAAKTIGGMLSGFLGSAKTFLTTGTGASELGGVMKTIGEWFVKLIEPVKNILRSIKTFAEPIMGVAKTFFKIGFFIGSKILAPLMTAFDVITGIMDGYAKGGILGGIIGGIKGFFKQFGEIGNLIKDAISWIAKKLGFADFSKWLDSFDFVKIINNAIDGVVKFIKDLFTDPVGTLKKVWEGLLNLPAIIGDALGAAWKWIKGLFSSDPKEAESEETKGGFWSIVKGALSSAWTWIKDLFSFIPDGTFAKLIDLVTAPVNIAINWIKNLFGFGDPEKPFNLRVFITDTIASVWNWVKSILSFKPDEADSATSQFGKFLDIVLTPVNAAINWIKNLFGFGDPDKPFKLGTFLTETAEKAWKWFKGLFNFGGDEGGDKKKDDKKVETKSIVDIVSDVFKKIFDSITSFFDSFSIKDVIMSIVPDWAKKFVPESWLKDDKKITDTGGQTTPTSANTTPTATAPNLVQKIPNTSGEQLKSAATEKANTEAVDAAKQSIAVQQTAAQGGAGGRVNMNNSSDNSNVTIHTGSMPDRTDAASVGDFSMAPAA